MSTQQTVLQVEGMTCSNCVRHVEGALRRLAGINGVEVDLKSGKVVVDHQDPAPTLESMIAALDEAGYGSRAAAAPVG